jgi:hypothetical protein
MMAGEVVKHLMMSWRWQIKLDVQLKWVRIDENNLKTISKFLF